MLFCFIVCADPQAAAAQNPPKPARKCRSCQAQPGDVLLLHGPPSQQCLRAAKTRSAQAACTGEELTLHVNALVGRGAVAEVYDVTVQQHSLPVTGAAGEVAPTDSTTAAAERTAGPGALQGKRLALKLCQKWDALAVGVQARLYAEDPATYEGLVSNNMQASHWAMSSSVLGAGTGIMRSHVLGRISRVPSAGAVPSASSGTGPGAGAHAGAAAVAGAGAEITPAPAILMDLAEGGSLQQLLDQVENAQGQKAMLSAEYAHDVIKSVLQTLERLHKAGWVYLDLKAENLVSMEKITPFSDGAGDDTVPVGTASSSGTADEMHVSGSDPADYLLVDFSSAMFLGAAEQRRQFKAMSTHSSPELFVDTLATRGADVWALGMLLLDMRGGAPAVAQHMLDDDQKPVGLLLRAEHGSTLQALRQEPQYAALTDREWTFVERCLAFDWQQRPSASDLLSGDYAVDGPGV